MNIISSSKVTYFYKNVNIAVKGLALVPFWYKMRVSVTDVVYHIVFGKWFKGRFKVTNILYTEKDSMLGIEFLLAFLSLENPQNHANQSIYIKLFHIWSENVVPMKFKKQRENRYYVIYIY